MCFVIYVCCFTLVLPSCGGFFVFPVENAARLQRVHSWLEDETFQIVGSNTEQESFGGPALSHSYHRQSKYSSKYPSAKHVTFFSACSPCTSVLRGFWRRSLYRLFFYGRAIWSLSERQGCLSLCSFSSCAVRKGGAGPGLRFMTYCVRGGPRQTGGSPNVSSSPPTRRTEVEAPFFNKPLMPAEPPPRSVSLALRREPSGIVTDIQ